MEQKSDQKTPNEVRVSKSKKNKGITNPPKKVTYKQFKQQQKQNYKQMEFPELLRAMGILPIKS